MRRNKENEPSKQKSLPVKNSDVETREDDLNQELSQLIIFYDKGENRLGLKRAARSDRRIVVGTKEFEEANNGKYSKEDLLSRFQFLNMESANNFFKAFKSGKENKVK